MTLDLVFLVLLLGHVLGDFYFQTDKMAEEKKTKYSATALHSLVYGLTAAAVLWAAIPAGGGLWLLAVWTGLSHLAVDSLKFLLRGRLARCSEAAVLLADQVVHLAALLLGWSLWGQALTVRPYVSTELTHLPAMPIAMVLALLLILKPTGICVGSATKKYRPRENPGFLSPEPTPMKNAGKTIGYLERIIVFALLMYGQFGAIAFVLTAKSVARFKSIEQNQALAEYYLIGTLMSVGAAFVITVLLGLCNAAK